MKLTVVSRNERFGINVEHTSTIAQVKKAIANSLKLDILPAITPGCTGAFKSSSQDSFQLFFQGSSLNNDCTVQEVGLLCGSTLRCKSVKSYPYILKIAIPCLSKCVELRDEVCIESTTIGEVKAILQNHIGIPVSVFNLQQTNDNRALFDNHSLSYYKITAGDTLVLHVWKGTEDLIVSALSGDISRTLSTIPSYNDNPTLNRYYLKVVLFIAAHMDFVNLAAQVIQRGVRCDEAVSEYPARQWCVQQSHTDIHKAAVHQAALRGSFRTLSIFLRHNASCIVAKDGNGLMPSTYALKRGHSECWKLLMVTQFQFHSVCSFSLPAYSKIMRWCNRAKDRVLYFKCENKKQMLMHTTLCPIESSCLGDPIVISGFHEKVCGDERLSKQPVSCTWSYNMTEKVRKRYNQRMESLTSSAHTKPQRHSSTLKQIFHSKHGTDKANKSKDLGSNRSAVSSISTRRDVSTQNKGSTQLGARLEARRLIVQKTGRTPSQIASKCFELGQKFGNMKWSSQMDIALKCSLNCIENNRHIRP